MKFSIQSKWVVQQGYPNALRSVQLAGETKKSHYRITTPGTFHTFREGSQCFMLPATCPWGGLLFSDLRSCVWSAEDEKTSLEKVSGRWALAAVMLGNKGGHKTGAMEPLWDAGLDSLVGKHGMKVHERELEEVEVTENCTKEPCMVFPAQQNTPVQSSPSCKLVRSFLSFT